MPGYCSLRPPNKAAHGPCKLAPCATDPSNSGGAKRNNNKIAFRLLLPFYLHPQVLMEKSLLPPPLSVKCFPLLVSVLNLINQSISHCQISGGELAVWWSCWLEEDGIVTTKSISVTLDSIHFPVSWEEFQVILFSLFGPSEIAAAVQK